MSFTENVYPRKQRGATRQSRRSGSPMLLLKQLMAASADPHKDGERIAILVEFREIMHSEEGKEYLDGMIDYWFANNYKTLLGDIARPEVKMREDQRGKQPAGSRDRKKRGASY